MIQLFKNLFTFHYVSTYTGGGSGTPGKDGVFTFHYVSTYTRIIRRYIITLRNLHSTMFLLIRFKIYYCMSDFLFTFHYVSTYTLQSYRSKKDEIDLHSTMFLLIR